MTSSFKECTLVDQYKADQLIKIYKDIMVYIYCVYIYTVSTLDKSIINIQWHQIKVCVYMLM